MRIKVKSQGESQQFTLKELLDKKPDGVYVRVDMAADVLLVDDGVVININGAAGGLLLEKVLQDFPALIYTRVTTPITLEITP